MFGDLRKYIQVLMRFSAIDQPITTEKGLREVLEWAIEAGEVLNLPIETVAIVDKVLNKEEAFQLLLATIRFGYSLRPEGMVQGENGVLLAQMETGLVQPIDSNEYAMLALEIVAFMHEMQHHILPVQLSS